MNAFLSLLAVAFILSFSAPLYAQLGVKIKDSKFYNISEVGYGHGIGKIKFKDIDVKADNESHFFRIRTQFGYFISNKFSLGLGIGLDGYHDFTFNTAPLFIDGRYYFKDQPQTYFIQGNLGYAIPLASNFEKGILSSLAIGRKMSGKRLIFLPSIGLNLQQLQNIKYYSFSNNAANYHRDNISMLSIQLNFGFLF